MRGRYLLGLSNANRKAAGVATEDEVEVEVDIDAEPRVVVEPTDFARALDADPVARAAYGRLTDSRKREHVRAIEGAKKAETRERRIEKALAMLRDEEPAGAVRPAPRLGAITPDIFETITPARRDPRSDVAEHLADDRRTSADEDTEGEDINETGDAGQATRQGSRRGAGVLHHKAGLRSR
jgi:hypothetical protein